MQVSITFVGVSFVFGASEEESGYRLCPAPLPVYISRPLFMNIIQSLRQCGQGQVARYIVLSNVIKYV